MSASRLRWRANGRWALLTGFCLVAGLFAFLGHARLRRFTPALFPALYAVLVWLEAPLSGASSKPHPIWRARFRHLNLTVWWRTNWRTLNAGIT